MNNQINRIVYVDDDSDDHLIFSLAVLEIKPTAILHTFSRCDQAISYLKDETAPLPDIIFLDQYIHGNQNNECLQELKKTARLEQVPIVIYTTGGWSKLSENATELGAYKYVIKPFIPEDIKMNLASIFTEFEGGKKGAG